jgi:hypothetical protein
MSLSATEVHLLKSTGWSPAPGCICQVRQFFTPRFLLSIKRRSERK